MIKLSKGRQRMPLKVVVYGPEGIGKSTFASMFPAPIFIDTEGSTRHMDLVRVDPAPASWTELLTIVKQLASAQYKDGYSTLVIDTADWAQRMCIDHVCSKNQKTSIEDWNYGKGYTYVYEEFGKLLNALEDVLASGHNVVINAHAMMRKFEQPDEIGSYDRWELKLINARQCSVAAMVKEWSDLVLFANYKTTVVNVDDKGAVKGKNKVQGGRRVMYTSHHPCWDAKNRFGLPEEMPFEYAGIAHLIPVGEPNAAQPVTAPELQNTASAAPQTPARETHYEMPDGPMGPAGEDEPAPAELRQLMNLHGVTGAEIRKAVAKVGFYPEDTPVMTYDPEFVAGMLIADWAGVMRVIEEIRKDAVPF